MIFKLLRNPSTLCSTDIWEREATVHDVRSVFNHDDSDAILLVDVTNAFNPLNRSVVLYNIGQLCSPLACVLITLTAHKRCYGI